MNEVEWRNIAGAAADARRRGEVAECSRLYQRALALNPSALPARNNLARALLDLGRVTAACQHFKIAAAQAGLHPLVVSNHLMASLYRTDQSPEQLSAEHSFWGQMQTKLPQDARPQKQKLRLAYLSPDFHFHPKAFLQIPHFKHFDSGRFELFLYSSAPVEDEYTGHAREACAHWREVGGQSPEEIAALIRRDGIDILIDITGHFGGSFLSVFALRPAPLQVSIPGYPATTGLDAVDYKIVDHDTDPPGLTEHLFTEHLHRLRRPFACYAPPPGIPEPNELPAIANGYVTFGSFNNRPKLNAPLMELWARILTAVPNSRLLLHHIFNGHCHVSNDFREPITRIFRKHGVCSRRLDFIGGLPLAEHFRVLAQADLALDSFPYNGMTTTCECLWMGVPVLTLAGSSHVSRVGVSLLTSVGMKEWITKNPDEYVATAVSLATTLPRLRRLRKGLRRRMTASPLTDSQGYVRALEEAFLELWQRRG